MLLAFNVSTEESFGGEFAVFIKLEEIGFVIALPLFPCIFKLSDWWQLSKTGNILNDLCF